MQLRRGFTLIEMVLGMVVLAIVMVGAITLLAPQASNSARPIIQIRASELAQSLGSEIMAKAFDENSLRNGGLLRCGEVNAPACTIAANLGAEEGSRSDYDDVDDFHRFNRCGDAILDSNLVNRTGLYDGFCVTVSVQYDNALTGNAANAKRIDIRVDTPLSERMSFAFFRTNY